MIDTLGMMMSYVINGAMLVAMVTIAVAPLWSMVSLMISEVDD